VIPTAQQGVDLAAHRCDVDDRAGLSLPHRRQQELREAGGPKDVHLELVARLVKSDLFDRAVEAEPGVVHEHVHASGFRLHGVDGRFDVIVLGNVHAQNGSTKLREIAHLFDVARCRVDVEAVIDEALRDFLAHTRGCPGYERSVLSPASHQNPLVTRKRG
jgi:hypothetical protein